MAQTRRDDNGDVPDDLRTKAEEARRELALEEERVSPDAGSGSEPPGEDVEQPDGASEVVRQRAEDQRLGRCGARSGGPAVFGCLRGATGRAPNPSERAEDQNEGGHLSRQARRARRHVLHAAIDAVRRGGTISLSGVYGGMLDPMPMMDLFDKQIQLRMGQANVKRWIDDILPLVANGNGADPLGVEDLASHRLPLEQAPHAYEIFQKKQDGTIKVLLTR